MTVVHSAWACMGGISAWCAEAMQSREPHPPRHCVLSAEGGTTSPAPICDARRVCKTSACALKVLLEGPTGCGYVASATVTAVRLPVYLLTYLRRFLLLAFRRFVPALTTIDAYNRLWCPLAR